LGNHPSRARFISGKLVHHFLGEESSSLTEELAGIYSRTGGSVKAMLRPLLLSERLVTGPPVLKRPFDFVVSALRTVDADSDGGRHLQQHLAQMGQPLY